MAPSNGGAYGDSDEDDGFDDDGGVPRGGGAGGGREDADDNPFAAFLHQTDRRRSSGSGGTGSHGGFGDDDSSDDGIEDVTPAAARARLAAPAPSPPSTASSSSKPTPASPGKYGGSARSQTTRPAAGWGGAATTAGRRGRAASSDDETAVMTNNKRKSPRFKGTAAHRDFPEEDYGTRLFTITDDRGDYGDGDGHDDDDDDDDDDDSLTKDMPRREKMVRRDSEDSAYEDASDAGSASEDPSPFAKYTGEEDAPFAKYTGEEVEDDGDDEEEDEEENPFGRYASGATRRAARQREKEELMDDLFPEDTGSGGRGKGGRGGAFGDDDDDGLDDDGFDDDDDESPRQAKSKDSGAGTTPTGMISLDKDFDDADYDLDAGMDGNYGAGKAHRKRQGVLTHRQWAVVLSIVACIFVLLAIIIGLSVALASSNKSNTGGIGNSGGNGKSADAVIDGQFPPARPHVVAQSYLQTYSGQDVETMESSATIEQFEELMALYLRYYASPTLPYIGGGGNVEKPPYIEGNGGNSNVEVGGGKTFSFGGTAGGGTRNRRSLASEIMGSVTVVCTFNFQRLTSSAARNRRHNGDVGERRERRHHWRGLRHRRAQDLPEEVRDAVDKMNDGTLSITGMAPNFYDDNGGNSTDLGSTSPPLTNDKVFINGENPPDELDGEAEMATSTLLDMMTAEREDSMHLEVDFTMTWSASAEVDEGKVLRDLSDFPTRFRDFMNSSRGKRQQLHDLTKVLELDVEAISDVKERESLKNKFIDVPTPAPSASASSQPTPGCCFGMCMFTC